MTKERKIAIEMWQDIREKVSNGEIRAGLDMYLAKCDWLKEHGIAWYDGCWFCNYFRKATEDVHEDEVDDEDEDDEIEKITSKTHKCPLNRYRPSKCEGRCVQYAIACSATKTMQSRLAAVDNIIKALKGEYRE